MVRYPRRLECRAFKALCANSLLFLKTNGFLQDATGMCGCFESFGITIIHLVLPPTRHCSFFECVSSSYRTRRYEKRDACLYA